MPRILSAPTPIYSNDSAVDVWNPLTRPIPTADLASVRLALWFEGMGSIKGKPAYQFSDDPSVWSGSVTTLNMTTGAEWKTTADWTFRDASDAIDDASGALVRFGTVTRNTAGGLPMQYATARIDVRSPKVNVGSQRVAPRRVWTLNAGDFVPLTPRMPAALVSKVRAELELRGIGSTSMTVQPAWQQADTPPDDWSSPTAFGTARTADGFYSAGAFATVTTTEEFVRLGVKVTQSSGSDVRSCIARVRFDWR